MVALVRRPVQVKRGTVTQRYWHAAAQRCDKPRRDLEQIAYLLKCRVETVRRAIELGLLT